MLSWPAKPADGWDVGAPHPLCTPGPARTSVSIWGAAATPAWHSPQPTSSKSHLGHSELGELGGNGFCFQTPIHFPPQPIPPPSRVRERGQLLGFEFWPRGSGPAPDPCAEGWGLAAWGLLARDPHVPGGGGLVSILIPLYFGVSQLISCKGIVPGTRTRFCRLRMHRARKSHGA